MTRQSNSRVRLPPGCRNLCINCSPLELTPNDYRWEQSPVPLACRGLVGMEHFILVAHIHQCLPLSSADADLERIFSAVNCMHGDIHDWLLKEHLNSAMPARPAWTTTSATTPSWQRALVSWCAPSTGANAEMCAQVHNSLRSILCSVSVAWA